MNNPAPKQNNQNDNLPGPLRCLSGSAIAGVCAMGLYALTVSIANSFANTPLPTNSQTAINISNALRTLVLGVSTMGTAIFGMISIGLVLLAIQVTMQMIAKRN
jgi:Protein of unknown function (DUF3082)